MNASLVINGVNSSKFIVDTNVLPISLVKFIGYKIIVFFTA